jgi:uncharacterized membrane protein YeaQ/YmgE (transglycosylase-associated protein family)
MIDLLIDVVEGLLSGDLSPDRQRQQRIARLVASTAVAIVVVAISFAASPSTASSLALAAAGAVPAWASAFSAVDAVKEYPPVRWVSLVTAVVGAGVVWAVGRLLIERLALGG